jgi:hypothetical protein
VPPMLMSAIMSPSPHAAPVDSPPGGSTNTVRSSSHASCVLGEVGRKLSTSKRSCLSTAGGTRLGVWSRPPAQADPLARGSRAQN